MDSDGLVVIVMIVVNPSPCCEPLGSGFKVALIGGEMVEINHWHFDTEQKLPVAKRNTPHKEVGRFLVNLKL